MFGEAKIEDLSAQAQTQAAEVFRAPEINAADAGSSGNAREEDDDEDDDEEVDATGVEERDIDIVMTQASVTRGKAVKALKENEGDVVNAIMALTM